MSDSLASSGQRSALQPRAVLLLADKKKRPPAGGLAVHAPRQNSFGIKLCPARSNRKLTIIPGMALTIKMSVLKWNTPAP